MISNVLFISAGVLSLLALWLVVICVRSGGTKDAIQRNISLLVSASMLCTLIGILELGFITVSGLVLTLTTVAGFTTLLVQNLYLIGMWQHGVRGLGLLLLPLTAIPLLLLPFLPVSSAVPWVEAYSFLETGHLFLSVLAYAMLTMAAVYAVMQLQLDRALTQKKIGFFVRAMPSLMHISNYLFVHVRWALWLLGLSIITGLAWQWVELHHFALFNHKVLLAVFAWVILMALYYLRQKSAWHHSRGSKMVLLAYATLMLAYFGVKIIQNIH
ncbi:MAG: cytochrome c biogenesis protein CcsA [Ghiorsea sp.]|nr:cytochrome c biogenesis protein CcsA [Ghiorsea sp.]